MKKSTPGMGPLRWTAFGIITFPFWLLLLGALMIIALYCAVARKNPKDYVHFQP